MRAASEEYDWDLQYGEIAMIFRGGCIIRAQFLQKIKEAYDRNPNLNNLFLILTSKILLKTIKEHYVKSLQQQL